MKVRLFATQFSLFLFVGIFSTNLLGKEVYVVMDKPVAQKLFAEQETSYLKAKARKTYYATEEKNLPKLSKSLHKILNRCGGFRTFYSQNEVQEFLIKSEKLKKQSRKNKLSTTRKSLDLFDLKKQETVQNWFGEIDRSRMNWMIEKLVTYKTRYYTSPEGIAAMHWIHDEWADITKNRSDVTLTKFKHQNFEQPSIILTFKGTDKADETLVFGGHGDSINTDDGPLAHAPGADDNAAGVALLTELIYLMVKNSYAPRRTISFMIYAAEEVGILGSYEITRNYRRTNQNVTGVMQFDGVNYQGQTFEMALISDLTNQAQNQMLGALIDEYVQVPWTYQQCGFACSDHAAWNYEGYPASYPVETIATEQNPHFHTARDTFDKSNNDTVHAEKFLKLAIAFLLEKDAL